MPAEPNKQPDPRSNSGGTLSGAGLDGSVSATNLGYTIATLIGISVLALISLRTILPDQPIRATAPISVALVALVAWYFLAQGKILTTKSILAFGVFAALTAIAATTGGVHAPVVVGYPVIILMTAWTISPRAALIVTGLTVVATFSFLAAESAGISLQYLPSPAAVHAGDQVVTYVLSVTLAILLVRTYKNRLNELRKVGADLTARTLELELKAAELNRAQSVAKVGSWVYEIAADTFHLSAEAAFIMGVPDRTKEVSETHFSRVHPDDRDAVKRAWAAAFSGDCLDHEHRIVVGQSIRWIRQNAELTYAADGTALSALGIAQDITERKAAEDQLRKLSQAIEQSSDTIMITDLDATIEYVNEAFLRSTGFRREDAIGKNPRLLQSGKTPRETYRALWDAMVHGRSWNGEFVNRHKDGKEYVESAALSPIRQQDGTVTHYMAVKTDITAKKVAEDLINHLAFFDPLTELPNRRLLLDRLKQATASSARTERYGALFFIDLDNFKTLNDTMGHDSGDLLLQQVGKRLVACVREGDTVARLGGDEFVLLLESLGDNAHDAAAGAGAVGEKVLIALNQPYQLSGLTHHSSPSIGVTLFSDHQGSLDDLLKCADLAMYQAKEAGRNTLRFFDPEMQASVSLRAELESDLHKAVQDRQFRMHYQAQVDHTGVITGVEALLRWQHPQRGLVSPLKFIPLAEDTGLIVPIGHWVLETACAQLRAWSSRPEMSCLTIAVNVSARQLYQPDFVDQIIAVFEQTGANPTRLKLELTESVLVSNVEDIIAKMHTLKAVGVGFSLDDFGTGYSSLSYLKRLPLDQLKIDQAFVRDILTDPNDAAIAKMVIALAGSLGISVIAEGVETLPQRDFLALQGCHAYQGYLYSRPIPIEEFEDLAARV